MITDERVEAFCRARCGAPVTRKRGSGKTPRCAECNKKFGHPKHYDANGVRYGTPGRVMMRDCQYCQQAYPRRKNEFQTAAVCLTCAPQHVLLVTPERKAAKLAAPSAKSESRATQRMRRKLQRAGLPDDWLERQGDVCGICGTTAPGGKGTWHIDHDHRCCSYDKPGAVVGCVRCIRGILCYHCNTGLGHFRDDPIRLTAAIEWVKQGAQRLAEPPAAAE